MAAATPPKKRRRDNGSLTSMNPPDEKRLAWQRVMGTCAGPLSMRYKVAPRASLLRNSGVRTGSARARGERQAASLFSIRRWQRRAAQPQGTNRRNSAREKGNRSDDRRHLCKGRDVTCGHAEQHRGYESHQADRHRNARREADDDDARSVAHDQPHDVRAAGAKRDANADFARPLADRIHDDGVDSRDGERERSHAERGHQRDAESTWRDSVRQIPLERSDLRGHDLRIDLPQFPDECRSRAPSDPPVVRTTQNMLATAPPTVSAWICGYVT